MGANIHTIGEFRNTESLRHAALRNVQRQSENALNRIRTDGRNLEIRLNLALSEPPTTQEDQVSQVSEKITAIDQHLQRQTETLDQVERELAKAEARFQPPIEVIGSLINRVIMSYFGGWSFFS